MEPTPGFRKQFYLEAIELPELVVFGDTAEDGPREQTPAVENPQDGAGAVDFVVHVGNLACFGIQVTGPWSARSGEEGGANMP